MKTLFSLIAIAATVSVVNAQVMTGDKTKIEFYSHTPVEDIRAKTNSVTVVVDFTGKDFVFKVGIKSFDFPNDQMEEHFNENYLESKKYPDASYSGKIVSPAVIDLTKDGSTTISTEGTLTIHGVAQKRTIPATISVNAGKVSVSANFVVKLVDHKINVPDMVVTKIAEEIKVSIAGTLKKA